MEMSANEKRAHKLTKVFIEVDGEFYTVRELADMMGKTTEQIRGWIRKGYVVEMVRHFLSQNKEVKHVASQTGR